MEPKVLEELVMRALSRELREQLAGGTDGFPLLERAQASPGPQLIADLSDRLYRLQAAVEDASQVVQRVESTLQELQQAQLSEAADGGDQKGQRRMRRRLGAGGNQGGGGGGGGGGSGGMGN